MNKATSCALATNGKHKWVWQQNFTAKHVTMNSRGTNYKLTLKGLYKCACGGDREGQPNMRGPDVRELDGGIVVAGATFQTPIPSPENNTKV